MRSPGDILYNFHWVVPGEAARAAQAYAGFLGPFLKGRGIGSVINLRGPNPAFRWWRYETRVCARLGIAHRDVKLNSRQLPTRGMLADLVDAFRTLPQPLLLKCSGGQDRTSFAAALYLLHRKGGSAAHEAEAQFARWPYLHLPRTEQRWLKLFIPFACEAVQSCRFDAWINESYTPEAFKAWLDSRGEHRAFRRIYGTPA